MSLNKIFQDKATILHHKTQYKKFLLNILYNTMLDSSWQKHNYKDGEKVVLPKL